MKAEVGHVPFAGLLVHIETKRTEITKDGVGRPFRLPVSLGPGVPSKPKVGVLG